MIRSEFFQSSWPGLTLVNQSFDDPIGFHSIDPFDFDSSFKQACEFSNSLTTTEDFSDISSINVPCFSTMFSGHEFERSPCNSDDDSQVLLPLEDYLLDFEDFTPKSSDDMECGNFASKELSNEGWSPSVKSTEVSMDITENPSPSFALPLEGSEFNNQSGIYHLLKAYAEAMECGHKELADVIMKCLREKVSPIGENLERLGFNFCQDFDKQGDYLRQESLKHIEAAFAAIYEILPDGRFAHFSENSAILEAMPADMEGVHIVDFDMGEGIQWPPVIEALSQMKKTVRLTSIKWENEGRDMTSVWSFEEVKRRLVDHARSYGLNLKVEEMRMDDLVSEVKRIKKRGGRKEFLAFNCNVSLPHMGRIRSTNLVMEFIRVAKELMVRNKGIITVADTDSWENLKEHSSFGSFFDANMKHYQALLDSIESNFPVHLREARMALESIFIAPYISSEAWFQKWKEMRESYGFEIEEGLEGWEVSRERVEEARELVKQKQSGYGVRIGGNNEMLLEWKTNPLVRISSWKN